MILKKEGFGFCFDESTCKKCNARCCIGDGYVFLSEEDIFRITEFLNITRERFLDLYTTKFNGRYVLIDLVIKGEKRCVFLNDNYKCEIYPVRPNQCKIFPFWENLKNYSLEEIKKLCPGIVKC